MSEDDELLRKVEALRESTRATDQQEDDPSTIESLQQHAEEVHDGFTRFVYLFSVFWSRIFQPVLNKDWLGLPFRWYKNFWHRWVYVEKANGRVSLSKSRSFGLIIATVLFLYSLPAIIGAGLEVVWDSTRMALTYKKNEVWYLGKSQEIDPEGNVFSAQGCEAINCTDQTSIYFRIKPSLAHHIWSLYHNGNVFFPDYVAGGIQNDVNRCDVTGYGSRLKFFVRNWDIYPQILSVDCSPLTESEIENQRTNL